jgi:glycopeptide antibiotics resistance protein
MVRSRRWGVALLLLVAYLVYILAVTLTPAPVDRAYEAPIVESLVELHDHGAPQWFGYGALELAGNVLLFLPLGFLAALVLPRSDWWLVALVAPVLSALIEGGQAIFLPLRVASATDVLANSLGATAGAVLALLLRVLVRPRRAP